MNQSTQTGLPALARRLGAGLVAGAAGTAAITLSSTAEMRLRHRPPSRAPLAVAERLLGIEAKGEGKRLAAIAHAATGISVGALTAGAGGRSAPAFFAASIVPELVLVPALTEVRAPWRWSLSEHAISVAHHAAYAVAAARAYRVAGG